MKAKPERVISFTYTNHRGEKRRRRVEPFAIFFGTEPPWHPQPGWLMKALDVESGELRTFAVENIEGIGRLP